MVLLLADGVAYQKIQDLLDTTAPTIVRWKRRFLQHRIDGLMEELHPGQQPSVRTPKLQAKVLSAIKEGPKDGSTDGTVLDGHHRVYVHLKIGIE
jgi:transposase